MTQESYKIIWSRDIDDLQRLVNEYLKQGYIIQGGICHDNSTFFQAIVKIRE